MTPPMESEKDGVWGTAGLLKTPVCQEAGAPQLHGHRGSYAQAPPDLTLWTLYLAVPVSPSHPDTC